MAPVFDELLSANERFVSDFDRGHLDMPPARKVAVGFSGTSSATPMWSATQAGASQTTPSVRS
jgi:hypothetical protein